MKTDAIDLQAITELVLGGRGLPVAEESAVIGEISALSAHRHRRVQARTALKNQLLGQLDRTFPGLSLALDDILEAKVGRLVASHFADPTRLAALGTERFIRYARTRGLRVNHPVAERLVAAARDALPLSCAGPAREVLAADLAMLDAYDQQIAVVEDHLATLLPTSPFRTLVSVPGWSTARAGAYCAGVGDPGRWPGPRQIYRASGLSPAQYESAGRRRDGTISREGSVALRRALIDLGNGLWHHDPPPREYAAGLRERGKQGKVIGCALANRANRIAYALVRDQSTYDPNRWTTRED